MADDGISVRADIRPDLVMNDGHATDTLAALAAHMAVEGPIFHQGDGKTCHGVVVRELTPTEIKALARNDQHRLRAVVPRGLLMPTPLTIAHVQDFAERHFDVVRLRTNPKSTIVETRPADFRAELATRFVGTKLPALRLLKGIAYTPILRQDGTIIAAHGYDADTALWMVDDIPVLHVPDRPTQADATAAYETLKELVAEHRFETDADMIAGISFLMTPALRSSLACAPLLVADAPLARTGKDYLLGTAARIASGHPPVEFALSDSLEEQQKRMGAALLMGAPCLTLNNINGKLRSTDLTAYLTQGGCVTRAYATTGGALYAPNGNVMMASGNNILLVGDLPERAVVSRQDADMASPGERRFKNNPHKIVLTERGKYLSAIFTIARWALVGADYAPPDVTGFGGFDDFDRLVRRPLIALTDIDPIERGREQLVAARESRWEPTFIDALATLFAPGIPFRTKNITEVLKTRFTKMGEADLLVPLRRDDLPYALRRAKGMRGAERRLAGIDRPAGAEAVAWYRLEALKPNGADLRARTSLDFTCTREQIDHRNDFSTIPGEKPKNTYPYNPDDGVIL